MNRLRIELFILALLAGVFLGRMPGLTDTLWARRSAYAFFDTIVDVRSELASNYVEEPDQEKMLQGAINGMVKSLEDPYTSYLPADALKQFDKETQGSFSGIGARIDVNDTGQLTIVSPLEDSPAFKAGVEAGDVILKIDGEPADDLGVREAVQRITGPEGTDVTLTVRHMDGEEEDITITRQKIDIQTVKGFGRDSEHHWNYMLAPKKGIGYIRVTQFSNPTAGALREAIDNLKDQGLNGLVLDLRFNPGGLLTQAVDISDMFLNDGKIVSTRGRNSPEQSWEAESGNDVGDFPMIVLVNQFSASASEIVSGALKDNERAIILGSRTFGKGSVQQVRALQSGDGAVKVTTAYYYLPSGRNLHRREGAETWGVDPNSGFYVPMTHEQIKEMNQLRRESEIIDDEDGSTPRPKKVTPEWIRENRADLQLAKALKAMMAKLETGEYPKVGESSATLQAHVSEKASLERRQEALQKSLNTVNEEMRKLTKKIAALEDKQAGDKPEKQAKADGSGDGSSKKAADAEGKAEGEKEPAASSP